MEGPVPHGDLPESLPVQQAAAWLGVSPQPVHKHGLLWAILHGVQPVLMESVDFLRLVV